MSETVETVKIKAADPDQGGFILVNKSDFDPELHELFEDDEPGKKTNLTVDQIKEALAAKGVAIPNGTTKKPDLQALLDAAE